MRGPASHRLVRAARGRSGRLGVVAAVVVIGTCVWVGVGHEVSSSASPRSGSVATTAPATPTPDPSTRRSGSASMRVTATPSALAAPHEATTPGPSAAPSTAPAQNATSRAAAGSDAPITDDTAVVTIGDSIMAGYGLDDPSTGAWPALLGTRTGLAVTNDSCSGAGFVATGDCDTDFDGLVAAAVAAHPAVIVIQSSDNDLGEDPTELAQATTDTVATIHAQLPDARIVGLSTLWDQPGTVPDEVADSSADLQAAVQAVGGSFVDIGQPIAGQDDLLQDDSEHPTDAGQQALATDILADLRAAGVGI